MKTVWLLLFYCCIFFGSDAQLPRKENLFRYFVTTDTGTCWLVTVKVNEVSNFIHHPGIHILRQLSINSYIIKSALPEASLALAGQVLPANNNWKLSPRLLNMQSETNLGTANLFYIMSDSIAAVKNELIKSAADIAILYENNNTLLVKTDFNHIKNSCLPDERIWFIDIVSSRAKEEASISGFDYTLNQVNALHNAYPDNEGKNIVVSVKENRPDTADIDFKGRYLPTTAAATTLSSHATIMSTIIAGGGNSFYTARGVAPAAMVSSSSFEILIPDKDAFYKQYNISVQNHAYGTGIENFYGADAAAYDASVNNNASLLHVFSAGNSGDQASTSGPFTNIAGFANLTGSFKMAKNIITAGSVDSFAVVPALSSKGPAFDGRVKPELVAYGEDGSSGAAALVSGTAVVLQDIYKKQHADSLPGAALVKAMLLNSARDAGSKGIDFYSGYGNLDAYRAAGVMKANHFFSGSVTQNQSVVFNLPVPANSKNLKILLSWTDPPAAANSFTALVNDLDLTVTNTSDQQQWLPWVLNSAASKDSLQLLPVRKRDSLNNIEQVTLDNPPPGNYNLIIHGFHIPAGNQPFFVVYQWDTANNFEWTYPTASDNLVPGKRQLPRWNSNFAGDGLLEFKLAGSNNWQLINNAAPVSSQFCKWTTPDTIAVGLLNMTINGQQFLSDSFTISAPLQTGVGYNCPGEALLYWSKNSNSNYQVYNLGNQYMQSFTSTPDTFLVVKKSIETGNWFSLAPVLPFNKTGIRSIAFDFNTQGVGCYVSNFTADLAGNTAKLSLVLGTTYHIAAISIEKADQNGIYQVLQSYPIPFQLQYSFTDNKLTKGINRYRLHMQLQDGGFVYSDVQLVYYLAGNDYLIYPNPVNRPQPFTIFSAQLNNPVFQLFNAYGQKLLEKKLSDLTEQLATDHLVKGLYLYVIFADGKKVKNGKLIVQ